MVDVAAHYAVHIIGWQTNMILTFCFYTGVYFYFCTVSSSPPRQIPVTKLKARSPVASRKKKGQKLIEQGSYCMFPFKKRIRIASSGICCVVKIVNCLNVEKLSFVPSSQRVRLECWYVGTVPEKHGIAYFYVYTSTN